MAPRRAESDFGLQSWIDTLGLKQIFLIFSVDIGEVIICVFIELNEQAW